MACTWVMSFNALRGARHPRKRKLDSDSAIKISDSLLFEGGQIV